MWRRLNLGLWHMAVPWLVGLFILFVAIVMQVEAMGYHFMNPAVFIVTYTVLADSLLLLWVLSWMFVPRGRVVTRERRTLLRAHQQTAQYRIETYSAVLVCLVALVISQVLLWHWYQEYVVNRSATVSPTAPLTDQDYASHRWFRYVLVIVALHFLALIRLSQALTQQHVLAFYDGGNSMGRLVRGPGPGQDYEMRVMRGDDLVHYHVADDGFHLAGYQDEKGPLEVLRRYLVENQEE